MLALHENQKKILEYLLDHRSGATVDELAEHLGVTKTAAKEHVIKVESMGFLTFEDRRSGVGRPRRYYLLSEQGNEAFPRQYSWLSNILLEFLTEQNGSQETGSMMEDLADRIAASMKTRFDGKAVPQMLAEITKAMNELGYRSLLKQSDLRKGAVIEASNCVYHSVAKAHPELCRFDVRFIEKASGGMSVKLDRCIARGDDVCRFCLRKR